MSLSLLNSNNREEIKATQQMYLCHLFISRNGEKQNAEAQSRNEEKEKE